MRYRLYYEEKIEVWRRVHGTIEANSRNEALKKLKDQGFDYTRYEEILWETMENIETDFTACKLDEVEEDE